ncbi:MAG: DNA helicase RecQ [Dehalococcoidia bacterium]|nr:DNA helicase RecQ [Dehalococcoidia bacterium]
MSEDASLLSLLKQYFGFTSFRPLQEEIIRDSMAGRDVLALLPTGGGKSLCFQLPALLRSGLTVVVSPLISLMKDQVDALQAGGVAATFLNSSLDQQQLQARSRDLQQGRYRLLYVAPERLMLPAFLAGLRRLEVGRIVIDEAHCISEWGHDFRKEYRQLAELRRHFPGAAIMALTATATERVRADIIQYLQLRDPAVHVGSFNRTNLTYRVAPKSNPYGQLLAFLRERPSESGIVYCQSRRAAEYVAERLGRDGVQARPYHAGLPAEERSRHQDLFSRDEVPVICATIAFGMGIDKPNVRFVIHYDLPKSIENYYQETGRAGRDGLPSECLLFFSRADPVKYERFIDETEDPREREIAREQLEQMVRFAESGECRRRPLLSYFGEAYEPENCANCDNCLSPRSTFDGTALARKFLQALRQVREKSGFSVGVAHVADVLAGGNTEKVRRWGHDGLAAYASGNDRSRAEWVEIGRELVQRGLLRRDPERFNVLEPTGEGRAVLAGGPSVTLTVPAPVSSARAPQALVDCDEALFDRLRALRKRLADGRGVPAFVIFSDVALRQMSRDYPGSESEFLRISGVGEKKRQEFAALFLGEIAAHLRANPRRTFPPEPAVRPSLNDSQRDTVQRFQAGEAMENIAGARCLARSTILGHLVAAAEAGERVDVSRLLGAGQRQEIERAFAGLGTQNLTGVYEHLGERFDYALLRLCRAARGVTATAAAAASPAARDARTTAYLPRSPASAPAPA